MMMEGTLTIDSPSLRSALHWTGQAPPATGGFGRFALKARANVVGASLALTNVNVELDGNVAEGVMTYSNNGRQTLQATLAADKLDFTPYISTFRLLASGAHDWNRQLFDLNALSTTDLDMRLSAAQRHRRPDETRPHRARRQSARRRAGALASAKRRCMAASPGARSGSRARTRSPTSRRSSSSPTSTCNPAPANCSASHKLSGRGNLNVSLVASGSSPFGLASSLDGTATPDRP